MLSNLLGIRVGKAGQAGSFSGNSSNLLEYLQQTNQINNILSASPSIYILRWLQFLSFHPDFKQWQFRSKVNPRWYQFLTRQIQKQLKSQHMKGVQATLQVGAWYDVPEILKNTGRSDIVTCSFHDGNLMTMLNSPLPKPRLSEKRTQQVYALEKKIYDGLDIIFPMSTWLKQSFQSDYGISESKLVIAGSGASIPDDLIFFGQKDYRKPNILFVGTDFERKGGKILLQAFSQVKAAIPNARLNILGHKLKKDPTGVASFGDVDKSSRQGKKIFKSIYENSSVFVLPSLYEPFGIVFVEAMANRIPCIGTNTCAMPEIIDEGKTGFLVPVNDASFLADRILAVLHNPAMAEKMGICGRAKYLKQFTWDVVANTILSTIHERQQSLGN